MPTLFGVTALVVTVLVMIFPRDALVERITGDPLKRDENPLAAQIGETLVRNVPQPQVEPLRATVAAAQIDLGERRKAHEMLTPLLDAADAAVRRDTIQKDRAIVQAFVGDAAPASAEQKEWLAELQRLLERAARETWDDAALLDLAREAVSQGWMELAGRFYQKYLGQVQQPPRAVVEEIVRHYLGSGEYVQAAQVYFLMQGRARTLAERREWFMAAVKVLQSSTNLRLALESADRNIGDLADDEETLQFLTRLALAANDQARAQSYARRLIRLRPVAVAVPSPSSSSPPWPGALLDLLVPSAHAQTPGVTLSREPDVTLRPYNETSYRLAYDVFVANSNYADARRVAEAAVAQRPADDAWQERLARVAEWMGDARVALAQWRLLAERNRGTPARAERYYQSVLRLAPGLADDDAELAAWVYLAERRNLTAAELDHLADLYERTARFDEGLAWFRDRYARERDPALLARIAVLADRAGRPDQAVAAYGELFDRGGLTAERAISLAVIQFKRGDFKAAFATLERARGLAPAADTAFWRLFGDLAWQLGADKEAGDAYARLRAAGSIERFELVRLVRLMRATQPLEAASLAEAAWLQTRDPQFFLVAVETFAQRRDLRALDRLFASVDLADTPRFRNDAFFFTLRASWHRDRGRDRQAVNDFRRALALRPADNALRAQFIWLVIELRDLPELRRTLVAFHAASLKDRALWPPFAAGWQILGEPRRALPYYRHALRERQQDYLWLLGYADALEDANEGGMAWRVRRHAWVGIRAKAAANPALLNQPPQLAGFARLAGQFAAGDASYKIIRQVLSRAPVGSGNAAQDAATRELVLGYTIAAGEFDRARAWMWTQYGRRLARPLWGEIAIALERNDLDTLERLVSGNPEALPRYDRTSAARAIDAIPLAQTLAADSLAQYPADDEMHQRASTDLRATASSVIGHVTGFKFGPLRGTESGVRAEYWATSRLRLAPFATDTRQRSTDTDTLRGVPGDDRTVGLDTTWRTQLAGAVGTETTFRIASRTGLAELTTLGLTHVRRYPSDVTAVLALGRNLPAYETAAMRVGGAKDEASLNLTYDFSKREYARLGLYGDRFHTQARTPIGSGERVELETGYRIRTDYPNLTARLYAAHSRFRREESTDELSRRLSPDGSIPSGAFFLPPSFNAVAAAIGFGQALRTGEYTRGVRPFADVGISYNSIIGRGFNATAGLAGSVFGNDTLAVGFARARGGLGIYTGTSEVFLRYQLYY